MALVDWTRLPIMNDWVVKINVLDVCLDVMDDLVVDVNDLDDYTLIR
jgi:hypothetical protein